MHQKICEAITFPNFQKLIDTIASKDTSAHPDKWKKENPLLGHCTVVSILAQDVFGGDIMIVDLHNVPGFEDIKWHSWNKLATGRELDFTKSQFDKTLPKNLKTFIVNREKLFTYSNIEKRYRLLKGRFDSLLVKNTAQKIARLEVQATNYQMGRGVPFSKCFFTRD
jgi:hypothetical protein